MLQINNGSNISSIIWHWKYILFILPASSSSCFYNQIILMTSTLLICKMKLVLIQNELLNSQVPNNILQLSSPPTEYPTTTPTQWSQIQFYQVLSSNRRPNYCESLFNFLLKFQSPTMTNDVRANSTSTHTERFGLNEDSPPKYWSENVNNTRATASRGIIQRFSEHPTAYLRTR